MPRFQKTRTLLLSALFSVALLMTGNSPVAYAACAEGTNCVDDAPATSAYAGFSLIPNCARKPVDDKATDKIDESLQPPGLDCALETFKNISYLLFGISGSVALLFFVYGGFLTLISGFSDQIKKGKEMIKNAVIGLLIIMVSSYAVDYFIAKLSNNKVQTVGTPCVVGGVGSDGITSENPANGVYVLPYDEKGQLTCTSDCTKVAPGYACRASYDFASCNDSIRCQGGQRCCAPPPTPVK